MPEPLEDLSVYFDDEGEDAVLDGYPVRVLYGAPGSVAHLGVGVGIAVDRPRVMIESASIPPRSGNAKLVLEFVEPRVGRQQQRYLVTEVHPDGTGMTTLVLTAAADQG